MTQVKGFSEKHQCDQNQADVTKEDVGHNRRKSVTMVTLYQSNGFKPSSRGLDQKIESPFYINAAKLTYRRISMYEDQIISHMNDYLHKAAKSLASWLNDVLVLIREGIHDYEEQHGRIDGEMNPATNVKPARKNTTE